MDTLAETLLERVDRLLDGQRGQKRLLSTTATPVAIGDLAARSEALEQAVREIAAEVQKLSAAREG